VAPNRATGSRYFERVDSINIAPRRQSSALLLGHSFGALSMMDLVMLAIGIAFFALTVGYVYGCDRL
jgi:hypothetical protein